MDGKGLDGERLRAAREAAGYTLRGAAEAVGLSHSYISQLESEFKDPGAIKVICALASTYGVSVDYLVGRTDDVARRSQADEGLPLEFRMALQLQRDVYRILANAEVRAEMFRYMAEQGGNWMGFLEGIEASILRELAEKYEAPVGVLQDTELGVGVE